MTDKEYMLLHSYLYNNTSKLECELKQLQNNVRFRSIDSIDCVELLMASVRLELFKDISRDIRALLKIASEEDNK